MLVIIETASPLLAERMYLRTPYTASVARIPTMTTTVIISTRVNPRALLRRRLGIIVSGLDQAAGVPHNEAGIEGQQTANLRECLPPQQRATVPKLTRFVSHLRSTDN